MILSQLCNDFLPPEYLKFGTVGNGQRPDIVLANSNAAQRPMYVITITITVNDIHMVIMILDPISPGFRSWILDSRSLCLS